MNEQKKHMESWKQKLRKESVGKFCEDIRCGKEIFSQNEVQVNHHVRTNHRHDIQCERDNVSICCKMHGSPEDYNQNGAHTTNVERIEILRLRYGNEAAERAKKRMAERGLI